MPRIDCFDIIKNNPELVSEFISITEDMPEVEQRKQAIQIVNKLLEASNDSLNKVKRKVGQKPQKYNSGVSQDAIDEIIKKYSQPEQKETPQEGSVVSGEVMPKEISDLYSEAASLRFTLNALKQQMGGKTLVGKAKTEYENTKTRLDNIELKLSEYEQSKSQDKPKAEELKKEKAVETKQIFEAGEEANYYDDLFDKTDKVKILYKTGDGENGTERYQVQFENGQEASIWSDKLQPLKATPKAKPEVTEQQIDQAAKKTGITPKNLRDLYKINRELFGLDRIKSLASAIAMDRMVGLMAKRAGITKAEMYGKLEFRKDTEQNVLKADNALFQGMVDGKPVTLRNMDVDVVNGFYSPIEKNLKEYGKDKIKAKDWLNVVGKGDEAVFTGVRAFLEGKDPNAMVSKQEILDYMKDNRISVVEVVKGEDSQRTKELLEKRNALFIKTGDIERSINAELSKGVNGVDINAVNSLLQEKNKVQKEFEDADREFNLAKKDDTKFSQYQLEGEKENYKEIMVILPRTGSMAKVGDYKVPSAHQYGEDLSDNRRLVHLRMNTRTDADGNKVLFLEEIQSDWGQTGKKEGFKNEKEKSIYNFAKSIYNIRNRAALKSITAEEANRQLKSEKVLSESQGITQSDIEKALDKYGDFTQSFTEGIPTAPFVTDTNAWTKLGLKVALKEAVAQGVDKIAWTTGTQQFDRWGTEKIDWVKKPEFSQKRYDELKQKIKEDKASDLEIDEFQSLTKSKTGGWTINIQEQFRGTAFEGMNVDEKALSEKGTTITSKEDLKAAIDRTLSREKNEAERQKLTDRIWDRMQKEDSGTSLPRKEGMESFYGTEGTKGIVGGVAEKLFGQKVGETKIETSNLFAKETLEVVYRPNEPMGRVWLIEDNQGRVRGRLSSKEAAEQEIELLRKQRKDAISYATQPSIDITPALRAEVERGLALFQRQQGQQAKGAMVTADGRFIIYAITDPNVSTPLHELAHVFEHYLTDAERAAVKLWARTKAWTTQTSEAFARGFEKYLSEGKAPTPALQKIFDKFKTWLTDIYNGITGSDIDIELNEPMREIYAKMLGIEQPLKATPQAGSVVGGDVKDYKGIFNPKKTGISGLDVLLKDDGYNYFYKGVSGEVVMMSPDEYLKRVRKGLKTKEDANIIEDKKDAINEAINEGNKIDMPFISTKDGKFSQEGRNRAVVARERGEKLIPVFIEKDVSFDDKIAKGQEYINSAIKDGATTKDEVLSKLKEQGLHRDAIRFIDNNFDNKAVEQSIKESTKAGSVSVGGDVERTAKALGQIEQNEFREKIKGISSALKNAVAKEKERINALGDKATEKEVDDYFKLKEQSRQIGNISEFGSNAIKYEEVINEFSGIDNQIENADAKYKKGKQIGNETFGKTYEADGDGILYRGVSKEDYERIQKQGFIDTDLRGVISEREGINLGKSPSNSANYLPNSKGGYIIAIDPKGLKLFTTDADNYIRTHDNIPIKNIVKVSEFIGKDEMGAMYKQSKFNEAIAEVYHKAKADGTNPELVKAVEQSLQATSQAEFDNSEQGDVKFLAGGKSNLSEADEVQEVSEIIEKAAKEGNLISVDINEDVPKTNIPIVRSEKRPEGKLMNALRIGLDFIKDSRIGIGMSDWLRTGDREVTELGVDGKPQKKTIRDEGGIGYPFKSLMDLINGVQTDVNKIFGWAGVDEGAGTRMINAAKSAKKITGKELKSHYYKSLPNLTPKEKARIEKAIPNNKEYGVVGIFKMGASGLHSNEAFSSEALRQIETKLNETEKEIFFIAVEERLNSLEWKGKDKYLEMFNKANNFAELDAILKDPKLSLDVKSSIMNKIILSTSETESKEGTLAKLLKDYDITLESITDVTKEPQMDNMGENELTILVAIDPTQGEPFNDKKRVRHNNYPYAVRGFPIGVLTEGMSLINLSPNLMGKYIKQSTLVVDDNASRTVDGKVEQKRIGLYQGADGLWYAEEGKGTTKKDVIEDGSTQSKYGENKSPLIFGNTKEDLIAKLEGKGYEISESAKTEAYAPQAPFLGGQTMTTLAATEIFSKPQFTPQEKLVKFLQKAFPNIVVEMTQKGFDAVQNNLIERKLLTKNGKAYGFIKDGKIYLDPSKLNNNTPIHEFGHIWSAVAKVSTPKVYQKGLSLVAGTKYEQSVLQSPEYQKIIKTLFGSDAIKKIGGKFIINENLPSEKLAELKEYIGDEALNKAIGDRGELFVNEAQRTNFKNWLDLLYTAIKNIMGISRRKASEIQKMNLNQFLDAVIADLLGGQKLSNVSSEKLSKEGDKMRFSAKETGNQSFQSNYGKGSRDLQEAERKLKEAWGKYLSNGISFDGMAEAEKERQLIVALLGYLKAKGIDIAKGIGNEVREFIKNKFGGVTDEMIDVAQGRMLTDYQKLYDIHMTPKNKEILDDMVSQVKSGEMSFEDFVNTIDNIVPNERIKNVFISYVNEQIDPLDGYVVVDEEIEEVPESPKTEISKEEERAFIGGLLARPINSKNFPNIVGGNKTDDDVLKRITAVTQEDVQDRKVMVDTSYVRVALEDIKEIALQNANALYMQFGEDWQTKVMDYLSDYLNAANPAQAIGILNVISTDVQQKIEKSQSPTERTKLFKLQDKADELSILFASQASLGINARKILRQFAQGGNMSKLVLDKILTEDTMETIEEINRIAASKPTNEELNNATLPVQTPQTPKSRIQKIKANVKAALSSKQKKKPKITEQEIKELGQRAEEERKRQGIQTKMSRQQIAQMLKDEAKKC